MDAKHPTSGTGHPSFGTWIRPAQGIDLQPFRLQAIEGTTLMPRPTVHRNKVVEPKVEPEAAPAPTKAPKKAKKKAE